MGPGFRGGSARPAALPAKLPFRVGACRAWSPSLRRQGEPGGDLLFRALRRSTIGAEGFHGRVRDGIGCWAPRYGHQVVEAQLPANGGAIRRAVCEVWKCLIESRAVGLRRCVASPTALANRRCRFARESYRCARASTGKSNQAERAISTSWLHALLRFHPWPIDVMVYHGSSGRPGFEVSFPLRCIQRLSRPHIATRRCRWRDNRYTRGASIPVLSY